MQELIKKMLVEIGEDADREGLRSTPKRFEDTIKYLTSGYQQNLKEIINGAVLEDEDNNEMIIVKDIELYSLCEHHLLPFFGKCHIGYIPNGKIIGLSKIARIVDFYGKRLQVQERMTNQIANTIKDILSPLGVAVVIEAQHLCMMMRGVEKQNSKMITSAMLGGFQKRSETRLEFLNLIKR